MLKSTFSKHSFTRRFTMAAIISLVIFVFIEISIALNCYHCTGPVTADNTENSCKIWVLCDPVRVPCNSVMCCYSSQCSSFHWATAWEATERLWGRDEADPSQGKEGVLTRSQALRTKKHCEEVKLQYVRGQIDSPGYSERSGPALYRRPALVSH